MVRDNRISYTGGYKYQLYASYSVAIPLVLAAPISTEYIRLDAAGNLFIKRGYAWDGASGPTIQTKNTMRGSLVHDALYQLMREKQLDEDTWRSTADDILKQILREDGMSAIRAWYYHLAVRTFGGPASNPANDKLVQTAP